MWADFFQCHDFHSHFVKRFLIWLDELERSGIYRIKRFRQVLQQEIFFAVFCFMDWHHAERVGLPFADVAQIPVDTCHLERMANQETKLFLF